MYLKLRLKQRKNRCWGWQYLFIRINSFLFSLHISLISISPSSIPSRIFCFNSFLLILFNSFFPPFKGNHQQFDDHSYSVNWFGCCSSQNTSAKYVIVSCFKQKHYDQHRTHKIFVHKMIFVYFGYVWNANEYRSEKKPSAAEERKSKDGRVRGRRKAVGQIATLIQS